MNALSSPPTVQLGHLRRLRSGIIRRAIGQKVAGVGPTTGETRKAISPMAKRIGAAVTRRSAAAATALVNGIFLSLSVEGHPEEEKSGPFSRDDPVESIRDSWLLLGLVGQIERRVRIATWKRDKLRPIEKDARDVLQDLWRKAAVRTLVKREDLSTPSGKQPLPDALYDRLLEALLWRLPQPPGTGVGAAEIRAGLKPRVGSRPGADEAERELPNAIRDWKRCCRAAEEVHGADERPAGDHRETVQLHPSDLGIGQASGVGILQSLRAIRARMQQGGLILDQGRSWATLQHLIRRVAGRLLRDSKYWTRAERALAQC